MEISLHRSGVDVGMEDLSKPRVDVSDLGALEKEEEFTTPTENCDEYEKHQHATTKEIIGNYV